MMIIQNPNLRRCLMIPCNANVHSSHRFGKVNNISPVLRMRSLNELIQLLVTAFEGIIKQSPQSSQTMICGYSYIVFSRFQYYTSTPLRPHRTKINHKIFSTNLQSNFRRQQVSLVLMLYCVDKNTLCLTTLKFNRRNWSNLMHDLVCINTAVHTIQ